MLRSVSCGLIEELFPKRTKN